MGSQDKLDDSSGYLAPPEDGAPDAWTAATADRHGSQKLLDVVEAVPPRDVADGLQQRYEERVIIRRRLMLLDGRPVEIADSYYPLLLAHGTPLADNRRIKGGAPKAIADLGVVISYADQRIELESYPTQEEASLLEVDVTTRVVRLFRTAFTASDTPVEVTTSVMIPTGRVLMDRISVA